ncbi:MAG: tyrosine-type recombinase/integrase [Methylococcales bacterium]|nr:tyrosine-type recombinase/integrase [Methylococcales bacterium]
MTNLTDFKIRLLKPKPKQYRERVSKGLYIFVNPKPSGTSGCLKSWYARYTFRGKREWHKISDYDLMPLEKAKIRVEQINLDIKRGNDPQKPKRIETVESYSNDYLPTRERNTVPRSFINIKGVVSNHITPAIGHIKLAELTKKNITDLLNDIESNASRKTAISYLKNMLDKAEDEKSIPYNVARTIKTKDYFKKPIRDYMLTLKQLGAYMSKVQEIPNPLARYAIELITLNGARKKEIIALKWEYIDLDNRTYILPKTKNGNRHTVYLADRSIEILRELKQLHPNSEYVFPSDTSTTGHISENTPNYYHDSIRETLNIPEFRIHDSRRNFSTHAQEELGADYRTTELSLAHGTRGVEAHYNKSIQRDERIKVSKEWATLLDSL